MVRHTIKINNKGCWIDDTLINEVVFDQELVGYTIQDRETEVDNLNRWICESDNYTEKEMMLRDLRDLLNFEADFFFSSISTNEFIFPDDEEFNQICKDILRVNTKVNDKMRNIIKGYYKIEEDKRIEVIDEIVLCPYEEILKFDTEDLVNVFNNFLKDVKVDWEECKNED